MYEHEHQAVLADLVFVDKLGWLLFALVAHVFGLFVLYFLFFRLIVVFLLVKVLVLSVCGTIICLCLFTVGVGACLGLGGLLRIRCCC